MKTIKYFINSYTDYQEEALEETRRQLTALFGEVKMVEVFNVEDVDVKTVIVGEKMMVTTVTEERTERIEPILVTDPEYQGKNIVVFEGTANIAGKDRIEINKTVKLGNSGLSGELLASVLEGGFETLNKITVGINGIEAIFNQGTKRRVVNARAAHLLRQQIQHKLKEKETITTVTANDEYKANNVIDIDIENSLAQFVDIAVTDDYNF